MGIYIRSCLVRPMVSNTNEKMHITKIQMFNNGHQAVVCNLTYIAVYLFSCFSAM